MRDGDGKDCCGLEIEKLFRTTVKLMGSELHLVFDNPPIVLLEGNLRPLNRGNINDEEMATLCFPMLKENTRMIFDK